MNKENMNMALTLGDMIECPCEPHFAAFPVPQAPTAALSAASLSLLRGADYPSFLRTSVGRLYLIRTAGLPLAAVRAIGTPKLYAYALQLLDLEQSLPVFRSTAAAALHILVNRVAKDPTRKADLRDIIDLKRDAHNGRPPRDRGLRAAFGSAIDSERSDIDRWASHEHVFHKMLSDLPAVAEAELEETRLHLHTWCSTPIFSRALQIANPDLEGRANHYIRDPSAQMTHKHRQIDDALLGYFLRACSKTSPFSSFGLVSHADLAFAHKKPTSPPSSLDGFTTQVRLNSALLGRLKHHLLRLSVLNGGEKLRLNPTHRLHAGRVHYMRTRFRPLNKVEAIGTIASQTVFSVPADDFVEALMMSLAPAVSISAQDLVAKLSKRLQGSAGDIQRRLVKAFELGLLESAAPLDTRSYDDAIEAVLTRARALGVDSIGRFVQEALDATSQLDSFDLDTRRSILRQLRESALALESTHPELQVDMRSSTLVYEDGTLQPIASELVTTGPGTFLATFAAIQRLQPLFDRSAPLRAALVEYFKVSFGVGGRCEDIPRLAEAFSKECTSAFWSATQSYRDSDVFDAAYETSASTHIGAAQRLRSLRKLCLRHLKSIAMAPGRSEVSIDSTFLHRLAERMPCHLHPVYSGSIFAQQAPTQKHPDGWVLNQIFPGSGQLMTRFLHLWTSNPGAQNYELPGSLIRRYVREQSPPGTLFAEVPGYGDTNLNFHPAALDYLIAANGESISEDRDASVFALSDLVIEHDATSDRLFLRSKTISGAIYPTWQGGMTPTLLPSVHKLLLLLGPSVSAQLPTWQSVAAAITNESSDLREYPRVVCANVTLMRRTWQTAASHFPSRNKGESDGSFYLRIQRWRSATSIPARFYATFDAKNPERLDSRKPVYFDFSSLRSILMFYKQIEGRDFTIWIAEALPDPGALTDSAEASHLREYVFDLTTKVSHQ